MASPSPADWALLYATAGWRSFPVTPEKKTPMFKGWQTDATTDPRLIAQYWNGAAGAERNLGLVCGEQFDAWDIEVAHIEAFTEFAVKHDWMSLVAPLAATGRGGIHLLTQPTGFNSTRKLYLDDVHIGELKSAGGFILACPSETVDLYRWIALPQRLELSPAPAWLLTLLERPAAARKYLPTRLASPEDVVTVLGRLTGSVAHANEGYRNSYLYWATRRAIEEGVPEKHAVFALIAAGRDAGLDEHEISQTIGSALHAESVAA